MKFIDIVTIATLLVTVCSLSLSIWNTVDGSRREKIFNKTFLDPAREIMDDITNGDK